MDKKLTDNEIKKALEYRIKYSLDIAFSKDVLDLLNRKDAEIERLKPFEKKVLEPIIVNLKEIEVAKSEAIKEFAFKLKKELSYIPYLSVTGEKVIDVDDIDTFVKEMTEGSGE